MMLPSACRSFCSIALSLLLIEPHAAIALQTAQQPSQGTVTEAPAIRVTTRLVQVNVVVVDKKGEPVRDLTKEDFALFDKRQEQTIQFFSKESSESLPANAPPLPA